MNMFFCAAEHVRQFLNTNLEPHLTKDNASKWLRLISRCGLQQEAKSCIQIILRKQLVLEHPDHPKEAAGVRASRSS